MINDLTNPAPSAGGRATGQIGADGNVQLTESPTGVPQVDPYLRTAGPLRVPVGPGSPFTVGQYVSIDYTSIRSEDGVTVPLVSFTDSSGRAITGDGAASSSSSSTSNWLAAFWVRPTFSAPSLPQNIIPLITGGVMAAGAFVLIRNPVARAIVFMLNIVQENINRNSYDPNNPGRASNDEPDEDVDLSGCGFHIQYTYQGGTSGSGRPNDPFRISALPPTTPNATEPPTTPTPPDSEDPGPGGDGMVGFTASTCGSATSTWNMHVFTGSRDGRGTSMSLDFAPKRTATLPFNQSAYVNILEPSDGLNLESSEQRELWRATKQRTRDRVKAMLAGTRVKLIDIDGIGRGRPTKLQFVGGAIVPATKQFTIRRGCVPNRPASYKSYEAY